MDFQGDYVQNNWVGKQTYFKPGDEYEDVYNQLKTTLKNSYNYTVNLTYSMSNCEPGCIVQIKPLYEPFIKVYTDYYIAMEGLFNTIYDTKKSGFYEYEIGFKRIYSEPEGNFTEERIYAQVNFDNYQNYTPDVYKDYEKKLRIYQNAIKTILEDIAKMQFSTPTNYTNFTKDDVDS